MPISASKPGYHLALSLSLALPDPFCRVFQHLDVVAYHTAFLGWMHQVLYDLTA